MAADILGSEILIVARTDSEAATLLDSNIDPRDHPFILGCTTPGLASLNSVMTAAKNAGKSSDDASKR